MHVTNSAKRMSSVENLQSEQVIAVLPAAGSGERTGLNTPKQFCPIAGYPIIIHTLQKFQRPWINATVVAVSSDWMQYLHDLVLQYGLKNVHLVHGGETRHRSIRACVQWITDRVGGCGSGQDRVVVIVHDAVRPFVAEHTLARVADAARKQGAAGVVCPLVSTTLATRPDGLLDYSLVRSKHCNSHTPQAFSYKTIATAYSKISEHDLDHGTEVLHLAMEYAGVRAQLIPTEDEVWKVTYRKDMCAAEQFARERLAQVAILCDHAEGKVAEVLEGHLHDNRLTVVQKTSSVASVPTDANAIIIIKTDPSPTQCMADLQEAVRIQKRAASCLKGSVSLLVTMATGDKVALSDFMASIRHLASGTECSDTCLYCIIQDVSDKDLPSERREEKREKSCQLMARLVLRQDELLTGQSFVV